MSDTSSVEIPIAKEIQGAVEIAIDPEIAQEGARSDPIVSVDDGIKSLQAQVEQAKRESAERLAAKDREIQAAFDTSKREAREAEEKLASRERSLAEASRRAQEAESEATSVKLDQIVTIIESLTKDKESSRRDYKTAMEAGDFDKAAEAQERMAMSAARIVLAERGKMALAEEVKNPTKRQVASQAIDPVEAVARTMGTQRSADWIRSHPEMVSNGSLSGLALSGHNLAVYNGHTPDSDGYFSFIEQHVKNYGQPPARQDPVVTVAPAPVVQAASQDTGGRDMSRASISAPVARDVIQAPGAVSNGRIRLDPETVQLAVDLFGPLYPKETRAQLAKRYYDEQQGYRDDVKSGRRT